MRFYFFIKEEQPIFSNLKIGCLSVSVRIKDHPTNKLKQIRKAKRHPQNANTKQLLQNQNGVVA
tara:strand:+ start:350 stop:541 length:192 start_codon:yes stop_codon:yes gene_type:complete